MSPSTLLTFFLAFRRLPRLLTGSWNILPTWVEKDKHNGLSTVQPGSGTTGLGRFTDDLPTSPTNGWSWKVFVTVQEELISAKWLSTRRVDQELWSWCTPLLFYRRTLLNVSQLFLYKPPPSLKVMCARQPSSSEEKVETQSAAQGRRLVSRPPQGTHNSNQTFRGRLKLTSVDSAHKSRGAADADSCLSHTNVNNAAQQFVWVKRFRDAKWCLTLFSCSSYPVYLSHWWWVCCLYNHYLDFFFFLCLYQFWVCVAAVGEWGKKNSRDLLV